MIAAWLNRVWQGAGAGALAARVALWPLTLPYRLGLAINRRRIAGRPWFDRGVPVILVGNLTVGGTGKTPVAAWVATALRRMGCRPVIVSRGYRGRRAADPAVVGDGRRVRLSPTEAGDEPVMLARRLRGIPVVVGRDRVAAAHLAVDRLGATALVLDDGFQQRARFPGALALLLVDGRRPGGNGLLLPAGPLREPAGAAAAADLILARGGPDRAWLRAAAPGVPVVRWDWTLRGLQAVGGGGTRGPGWLRGRRILAASGIGSPDPFAALLERWAGPGRVTTCALDDHHAWDAADVARVGRAAAAAGCAAIVVTEKDAVKWPRHPGLPVPVLVAVAAPAFADHGRGLASRLREALRRGGA